MMGVVAVACLSILVPWLSRPGAFVLRLLDIGGPCSVYRASSQAFDLGGPCSGMSRLVLQLCLVVATLMWYGASGGGTIGLTCAAVCTDDVASADSNLKQVSYEH
uniref:Uncharacterized protein n=1 Tax=Arundo donax TaxID=35708 RepID=A0A0A9AVB9_ARUDO